MAGRKPKSTSPSKLNMEGITRITVGGFKSINQEHSIEIRPLTILAGANSSGKSSLMQPLLLLKQTLEATYDPGALLLNGPNVRFISVGQLLSHINERKVVDTFHVGLEVRGKAEIVTHFIRSREKGLEVEQTIYNSGGQQYRLYRRMPQKEVEATVLAALREDWETYVGYSIDLIRDRCFLTFTITDKFDDDVRRLYTSMPDEYLIKNCIRQMVHLPGLRGNPERTYPVAAVGSEFPGTFEKYVASIIGRWQADGNNDKLSKMNRDLTRLGLTGKVIAKPINDTQVELLVNRFIRSNKSGAEDMVSIADSGFGVSQTLPVVVALHAVNQGQLLYIEQPEIHLHPRAQSAMAEVLADAAKQGKRLVVETHSSALLLGIQTLVAEGKLPRELVKLHWFKLLDDGSTQITSADLDEAGAFGDWPEDFAEVTLDSESRYLDAAQARLRELV
jgi:predicted ATPase